MTGKTPGPEIDRSRPGGSPQGRLFVISAPSGAGKTTLCRVLLEHFPDMVYSVSATTRKPRKEETHGVDYFFISREEFEEKIRQQKWAEWARVHDHYYGTSVECIERHIAQGENVLLDIDVQGTRQILRRYPDSITIFILPPSIEALRERMVKRGTDDFEVIEKRMQSAKEEMAQKDMYRHVIVNDTLEDAAAELISLVKSYLVPMRK
ncbi:MAG: guanylate kinase [Desulfobacterales bacterium]